MAELSPNAPLTRRIEAQLAEAGLQVAVESSEGSLILSGIVESEESREAAADIVAQVAPDARIDNQLDVQSVLPTDIDDFAGDEPTAEMAETRRELAEDAATTDLEIVVAVRQGVAHLRGRVSDLDDADNAESVAARVPGIREVVEELDVANV